MSAEDDKALLDAIEHQVRDMDVSVTFTRCWINAGRPLSWQVTFKLDAAKSSGEGSKTWASGGGNTLREALGRAFAIAAEKRLS